MAPDILRRQPLFVSQLSATICEIQTNLVLKCDVTYIMIVEYHASIYV
jgi:hypothetical protein